MKKGGRLAALVCLFAAAFAGCGRTKAQEAVEATTVIVDKGGGLTYHLVEDFDKEYYSLSELSDMVRREAADFNGGRESRQTVAVDTVERLQGDEGRVLISYRFDGYQSFHQFTQGSFFYGTVDEAFRQGHIVQALLKSVKDGTLKTEDQLRREGAKKIIITAEKALIYCPAKVTYLSDGAVLREDGSVDASAAEKMVYILMK